MPTYTYECTECGDRFDIVQAFSDNALTTCERCAGRLRKRFNSVGIVFKGSGFYRTDSRESGKSKTSANGSGGDSASSSTSTEKSTPTEKSGSGDSKPGASTPSTSSSPSKAAAAT
ncbi:FmdB family zinc ribbon protein [Mycobacterium sp. 050134]|uniref:FmdB family zinc ribbon protein n=1 Tax=Mycobacterium sp. 050134 TaxID=3096111 RepID=UPI002ED93161